MASYHFSMKYGAKGKTSASEHAQYVTREGKYSRGEMGEELVYKEHGNMPEWAKDKPQTFWQIADEYERAGGRTYQEMEVDLPNELTREQQIDLIKEQVGSVIGKDRPYTFAIHTKRAKLDGVKENPHAHIMWSERKLDQIKRDKEQFFKRYNAKNPEKGGCQKDDRFAGSQGKLNVKIVREEWANLQNKHLEKHGHEVRVDHRTLKEQRAAAIARGDFKKAEELNRPPEKHLGPKAVDKIVREAQNIIQKSVTPKEAKQNIGSYLENHENEKVKLMHNVRQFKQTEEQLRKMETPEQTQERNVSELGEAFANSGVGQNIGSNLAGAAEKIMNDITGVEPEAMTQEERENLKLVHATQHAIEEAAAKNEQRIKSETESESEITAPDAVDPQKQNGLEMIGGDPREGRGADMPKWAEKIVGTIMGDQEKYRINDFEAKVETPEQRAALQYTKEEFARREQGSNLPAQEPPKQTQEMTVRQVRGELSKYEEQLSKYKDTLHKDRDAAIKGGDQTKAQEASESIQKVSDIQRKIGRFQTATVMDGGRDKVATVTVEVGKDGKIDGKTLFKQHEKIADQVKEYKDISRAVKEVARTEKFSHKSQSVLNALKTLETAEARGKGGLIAKIKEQEHSQEQGRGRGD